MALSAAALREMLRRYRLAQINNGAATAALVLELGRELAAGRLTLDEFEVALLGAEKLGFDASAGIAARHVAELRAAHEVPPGPVVRAQLDLAEAAARVASTMGALARLDDPGARARAIEKHAVWADRGAKMGGRETVGLSASAAGRRWRRVPDGDPCAWCGMLATRGYLDDGYTSREAAQWTKTGKTYHNFCGCVATEIVDDWEPTEQEQRWIDAYEQAATDAVSAGLPSTPDTIVARMREAGAFSDSPYDEGHLAAPAALVTEARRATA